MACRNSLEICCGLGKLRTATRISVAVLLYFVVLTAQFSPDIASSIGKRNAQRKVSIISKKGQYLAITHRQVSGKGSYSSDCELQLRAIGVNGEVTIKGIRANKYLAMNSLGQVYLSATVTQEAVFFDVHILSNIPFRSFRSKSYPTNYLAVLTTGSVGNSTVQNSPHMQFAVFTV